MRNLFLCVVFSLLAIGLATTTSPSHDRCEFGVRAAKESANAVRNLAVQLYQKITTSKPNTNVIFSPVSIALALALVESGAAGTSRSQIQRFLSPPGSNSADSSDLYQSLQRQLQINSDKAKVNIANGLFYSDKGLELKADYVSKVKKCFETQIAKEPFQTNPDQARLEINQWVSNATAGKIPNLFQQGSIDSRTLAVLASAIYLKAAWDEKFDRFENLPFYQSGNANQAKTVSFMVQQEDYHYAENDNVVTVGLPYSSVPLTMYILLPKQRSGIQAFERSLTGETLKMLLNQTTNRQVALKLPKFTIRQSTDLKSVLQQLGVQQIFTDSADFSRMAERGMKVSDALHEAYIKVNENGTEAAAVTAFKMVPLSARYPPEQPVSVIADHPFIFAIVHEPTSAILFMGKVNSAEE